MLNTRFRVPVRSSQSRRATSASRFASVACAPMPIVLGDPTEAMVGWERRSDLQVGYNPNTETFGKRETSVPGIEVARHASGRINGRFAFRSRSAVRVMRSRRGAFTGGIYRRGSIGGDGSASLSCIPASRLT